MPYPQQGKDRQLRLAKTSMDQCRLRKSSPIRKALLENTKLRKNKNDQDWDRPVLAVGISGLRENFGRDRGIKEPFWEPSMKALDFENAPSNQSKENKCLFD